MKLWHLQKRSVRVLNSIWSALERSNGAISSQPASEPTESSDTAITGLTKGVSKLQLVPNAEGISTSVGEQNKKGASFWSIVTSAH